MNRLTATALIEEKLRNGKKPQEPGLDIEQICEKSVHNPSSPEEDITNLGSQRVSKKKIVLLLALASITASTSFFVFNQEITKQDVIETFDEVSGNMQAAMKLVLAVENPIQKNEAQTMPTPVFKDLAQAEETPQTLLSNEVGSAPAVLDISSSDTEKEKSLEAVQKPPAPKNQVAVQINNEPAEIKNEQTKETGGSSLVIADKKDSPIEKERKTENRTTHSAPERAQRTHSKEPADQNITSSKKDIESNKNPSISKIEEGVLIIQKDGNNIEIREGSSFGNGEIVKKIDAKNGILITNKGAYSIPASAQ